MFCLTMNFCKKAAKMLPTCTSCDRYLECAKNLGLNARIQKQCNIVENIFPDGSKEVIIYNDSFNILVEECNRPDTDRSRKFQVNDEGIAIPIKYKDYKQFDEEGNVIDCKGLAPKVTLTHFSEIIDKSNNRALDNFYGYGLSNIWDYFVTLTFNPDKVDRYNDLQVKDCWTKFLKELKNNNPNAKVLLVPERHKKGAIHFHGFLSNVNITLEQAFYPDTVKNKSLIGQPIKSKCGDYIFNIKDWTFGHSTCAILPKELNNRKVVNYCLKYMRKDSNVNYNQKRYFRTQNLNFKEKICSYIEDIDINSLIGYEDLKVYKKTDKFIVFRSEV